MEKLNPKTDGATTDIVGQNMEKLKELFPDVFTEGKIDFDALRETLGDYVEDSQERYSFTWNGKSRARRIAQTPSTGTLRPCPEESVNWDTTQNLLIEGDNLEVLKLLQKSYHKRVKMIYIDPPYNTGKEFIYPDRFQDNLDTYLRYTGQIDDEGLKLSANAETSGRYHTNWLNMMLPRLKLARNLLRDDGVMFVSIDDTEAANLRKLCDEVFGEENFVANVVWEKKYSPSNDAKWLSDNHDHILVYAKNKEDWRPHLLPRTQDQVARYKNLDSDLRGPWKSSGLDAKTYSEAYDYPIVIPSGRKVNPPAGSCWRYSKQKFEQMVAENRIWFGEDGNNVPSIKRFLSEVKQGVTPLTVWRHQEVGHNQDATQELKSLFGTSAYFDTPKPVKLLKRIVQISSAEDDLCMDFFAGSCSTAEAVMRLNIEDGGSRCFLMVQLPEPCANGTRTFRDGFPNIAEISKERIRRVIQKIETEQKQKTRDEKKELLGTADSIPEINLGFKAFKLDVSNIKPWDADFDNLETALLDTVENIKPDRTEADVLYELLLKYGLDLREPEDMKWLMAVLGEIERIHNGMCEAPVALGIAKRMAGNRVEVEGGAHRVA